MPDRTVRGEATCATAIARGMVVPARAAAVACIPLPKEYARQSNIPTCLKERSFIKFLANSRTCTLCYCVLGNKRMEQIV